MCKLKDTIILTFQVYSSMISSCSGCFTSVSVSVGLQEYCVTQTYKPTETQWNTYKHSRPRTQTKSIPLTFRILKSHENEQPKAAWYSIILEICEDPTEMILFTEFVFTQIHSVRLVSSTFQRLISNNHVREKIAAKLLANTAYSNLHKQTKCNLVKQI